MRKNIAILAMAFVVTSCSIDKDNRPKYLRWIGDIQYEAKIDGDEFELCNGDKNVRQYFNMSQGLQFEGEKIAIIDFFNKHYKPLETTQSGWIRVRFIVNCKGQTGRFRLIESDENYQERSFDKNISNQIMNLTKSLEGWKILKIENEPMDYYQYLLFKINNGHIEKVLP